MSEPVYTPDLIEALVPGRRYRVEVSDSDQGLVGWFEAVFRAVLYSEDRDGKRYVAGAEFDGASLGVDGGWTFKEAEDGR